MGSGVSSFGKRKESTDGAVTTVIQVVRGPNNKTDNSTVNTFTADENAFLSTAQSSVPRNSEAAANHFSFNSPDDYTDRFLSNCCTQESPQQNSIDAPYSGRSGQSEGAADAAEMFAHTAMSLGMDNDELLFNLMYFEEGQNASFGAVMNSVQTETLALHSENNTPYKLKPASSSAIDGLHCTTFSKEMPITEKGNEADCECAVCKDEIEEGNSVLQLPSCQHVFHEECLLRWINLVNLSCLPFLFTILSRSTFPLIWPMISDLIHQLFLFYVIVQQGWCPVCRAPIESSPADKEGAVLATAGSTPDDDLLRHHKGPKGLKSAIHDLDERLPETEHEFEYEREPHRQQLTDEVSGPGNDRLPLVFSSHKLGGGGDTVAARLFEADDDMDPTVREDSTDYGASSYRG